MKSKRKDGRGHWARGKPRSTLTEAQAAAVRRKLERALESASAREVGRILGMHGTTVARIARGEDVASERTAELVRERL